MKKNPININLLVLPLICLLIFLLPGFLTASGTQILLFELEPACVKSFRQPTAEWMSQLDIERDGNDSNHVIAPVKWHSNAEYHPLLRRIFSLEVPANESVKDWTARLKATPGVVWVEPAPVRHTCELKCVGRDAPDAPPNDPFFHLQWALSRVQATAAWDISRGDAGVTIAIVDIGVDIDHKDLSGQIWINRAEADGIDGLDDDNNGFIDDVHGWDFADRDPDPRPGNSDNVHGTHVAGIAAAQVDNGYGIAGIGWNCRFMSVRVGYGSYISHGYAGIVYAAASGADIISLSWGSGDSSNIERLTVEYAAESGALVVAAAGNINIYGFDYYPAAYEHVLAVTAVTSGDRLADFSNYAPWVDISAPGDTIISTIPGGFGLLSGTSMATPLVAGAAGLLKALNPDWTPVELELQLKNSSDPIDHLNPQRKGLTGVGRLNVFRTLYDSRSGFELGSITIDDRTEGNGNNIIDPNETILISVSVTNVLTRPAIVTGRMVSSDRIIDFDRDSFDFGQIDPGVTANNNRNPFRARIGGTNTPNRRIECKLELIGPDVIEQSLPFALYVRPQHDDHDNGSVSLTVTDFGALGYRDYMRHRGLGNSFRYPEEGPPVLFHGSLMIGAPPGRVSDCAYGDTRRGRYDFTPSGYEGFVIEELTPGKLEGHAEFTDDGSDNPLNVQVRQDSYSFSSAPDDDYVILSYKIINRGTRIDDLYVGLFLDWDIVHYDENFCRWDPLERVGWMGFFVPSGPVYGAGVLDQRASFLVALPRSVVSGGSNFAWSDSAKLAKMKTGFHEALGSESSDWAQLIGAGPFDIASGDSVRTTFAVAAGDNPDDFIGNIRAARAKWNASISSISSSDVPTGFRLVAAYPSPFNNRMKIICSSDIRARVNWSIYDIGGRLVQPSRNLFVGVGQFTVPVDASWMTSGRYLVFLEREGCSLTVPVTLVR